MYEIALTIQIVDIRSKFSGLEKVLKGYGIYANGVYLGKITQWEPNGLWEIKLKGKDGIKRKRSLRSAISDLLKEALKQTFPDETPDTES